LQENLHVPNDQTALLLSSATELVISFLVTSNSLLFQTVSLFPGEFTIKGFNGKIVSPKMTRLATEVQIKVETTNLKN